MATVRSALSALSRAARRLGRGTAAFLVGSSSTARAGRSAPGDHPGLPTDRAQAHLRASTTSSQTGGLGS